ncbi:MAG: PQQ-binding-like beta-propeller repeat protein [Armatimonadetes bacterium]|nr:PQQ-binding-like beta-propeller repeat protein [Armatimonadota bacterium]MDE2206809.1 PQQ-binding-like beta-propeller repeat protein [Armatimonadota bacterium]
MVAISARDGTRLWVRHIGGDGYSSPAAVGGRVYVGGGAQLWCLSAASGRVRWRFRSNGSIETSPALVPGKVVFFGSDGGYVYAVGAITGRMIWKRRLRGRLSSSPALDTDGQVFIGRADGSLVILTADDGAIVASLPLMPTFWASEGIFSTPAVCGRNVVVGTFGGDVIAVSRIRHAVAWRTHLDARLDRSPIAASCAVDGHGHVLVGSADHRIYSLNSNTGAVIWRFDAGSAIASSAAVSRRGYLAVGTDGGNVLCLATENGGSLWSLRTGGRVYSSPALSGGEAFVGSEDGYLYCLK